MWGHRFWGELFWGNLFWGSPQGTNINPETNMADLDRPNLARALAVPDGGDLASRILLDPAGSDSISLVVNNTGTTAGNTIGAMSLVGVTAPATTAAAASIIGVTNSLAMGNSAIGALTARVIALETRLNSQIV